MGSRVLLADNDANYVSLMRQALIDSGYLFHPAESREMALYQVSEYELDAAVIDICLPGGIAELIEACLDKSIPIVSMGDAALEETEHLVTMIYYKIPYFEKYGDNYRHAINKIIARINVLTKLLVMYGNNREYQLGMFAGLNIRGYKVAMANTSDELLIEFLSQRPEAILIYSPSNADLEKITEIRKRDSKIPIVLITRSEQSDMYEQIPDEATIVVTQDKVAEYLEELWKRPCRI